MSGTNLGTTSDSQIDPGESNDPKSFAGSGFDAHVWYSVNQIFERLGKIDQKIDGIAEEQNDLKKSVEKHDKLIMRAIFSVGGAVAILIALWFVYEQFLKGHIFFK
jgi:hypothetical protein